MQATIKLDEVPTAPEPGTSTALAPLEEPVIDGEVTALIEPEQTPTPKQRPYYLIVVFTILACLVFIGVSLVAPLFTKSATVTIIPREEHISTTIAILIHGRLLPALTLSQSTTVPATGKRHQNATRATGAITFYNGLFTSQTIGAGTILTSADGVQIVTDEPAVIPAGNPPIYGHVTVSAHAVSAGVSGNIQAFDIDEACCLTSVLAKNATAFTGGAEARDYLVVTRTDIDAAAVPITTTLEKSQQAALAAQVNAGEALTPPLCSEKMSSDHQIGQEAKEVTVSVSETCDAIAYQIHTLHIHATQMIRQEATKQFGTGYSLLGDVTTSVIHATIVDQAGGVAALIVKLDATYVYQITPGEKRHLIRQIAGKTKPQALAMLFQQPGIQAASVSSNAATLPEDPGSITIVVVYRSASM